MIQRTVGTFLTALLAACSTSPASVDGPAMTTADGQPNVILTDDLDRWPADDYTFQAMRLSGDTLDVDVSFGGGCRAHEFALSVHRVFMESHPVQVRARLAHDANGDPCRALLHRTLRFDLAPLRTAYQRAYGAGPATIVIHVTDWRPVHYTF
jgi:hypothetical protein